MKITPRPVAFSEEADRSRDIAGVNKWARSSRAVGLIMLILGWFTIPVEVLLRRDFGQRWFTAVNFYAGLFLLLIFSMLQYLVALIWGAIERFISRLENVFNPDYVPEEPSLADRLIDRSMLFILAAYVLMGSYHRFKIWWRNRTNTALHSYDDGTSRLEPLAGYLMQIVNVLALPLVHLYARLIPKKQRAGMSIPRFISDRSVFANTVVEPVLLLILAIRLHGIISLWLFISAIALAVHASWKETAKLNKILDFRDSVIEAKVMAHLMSETQRSNAPMRILKQAAETIKSDPEVTPHIAQRYPDLMSIIEEINREKGHLAK